VTRFAGPRAPKGMAETRTARTWRETRRNRWIGCVLALLSVVFGSPASAQVIEPNRLQVPLAASAGGQSLQTYFDGRQPSATTRTTPEV
jgi:hypothetical protein